MVKILKICHNKRHTGFTPVQNTILTLNALTSFLLLSGTVLEVLFCIVNCTAMAASMSSINSEHLSFVVIHETGLPELLEKEARVMGHMRGNILRRINGNMCFTMSLKKI